MATRMIAADALETHLPDSGLGDLRLRMKTRFPLDPMALSAVDHAVRKLSASACDIVHKTLAAHPDLCIRCARTLMRAALGSGTDRQAVGAAASGRPVKAGDDRRYELIDAVIGNKINQMRIAGEQLRNQVVAGKTSPLVEQACQAAHVGNRWAPLYHQSGAGWPMKASQWSDYQSCACGEPDSGNAPTNLGNKDPLNM